MADRTGGERKLYRNGGSALRVSAYVDPIALVGITLSIVVSVALDLLTRAKTKDHSQTTASTQSRSTPSD